VSTPAALTQIDRLDQLASEGPDELALVAVAADGRETALSRRELLARVEDAARHFARSGVDADSLLVVALANGIDHVVACHAAWWLGACVTPLSPVLPGWEFGQVLASAVESGRDVRVFGAAPPDVDVSAVPPIGSSTAAGSAPPRATPDPGIAMPSGGSTGRPKLIVDDRPMLAVPGERSALAQLYGQEPHHRVIVVGPLYHTGPFGSLRRALFDGGPVVLMERFEPRLALELIERHQVNRAFTVPAQLLRMAREPTVQTRDLSSFETLYHSGAPCPGWLKRFWIDRLGPERVIEGYGSTEAIGALGIRGDEWLAHPGSVGRPIVSDVKICDEGGRELPVGEVGEIFMRWRGAGNSVGSVERSSHRYWGSPQATRDGAGFVSVGDLGRVDADGYVYIVDRRVDMIVSGGANIFPAEVEAVLGEHGDVDDVAVVGVPDEEWGRRVHAIVATNVVEPGLVDDLDRWCRARLGPTKVPKTYELVAALPRNAAGKLRRAELAAERAGSGSAAMIRPRRGGEPSA